MATAPTLFWYQISSGTLAPVYFGQLNATVAELCSENAVTAPTAPWQNSIGGTLFSKWQTQIDTAVRALCTALSVTAPIPLVLGSNTGQYQSKYAESLDGVVRALCEAVSYEGPLDLVPGAVAAYGQRALSAAQLGQNLYTIRRSAGGSQTFASNSSTGDAPAADITTFIGGGSGFVSSWVDQSGGGHNTVQATEANQPIWTAGVSNSKPGFLGLDNPGTLQSPSFSFAGSPFTMQAICGSIRPLVQVGLQMRA